MTRDAKILVVIVNYNSFDFCQKCLESLAKEKLLHPHLKIHVVDNCSPDGSAQNLQELVKKKNWHDWVQITAHPKNDGFGAGNNVALEANLASNEPADFYLLINPDTEVRPGAVGALLDFMQKNPQASILGPRTESTPGQVDPSAFRFPSLGSDFLAGFRVRFFDKIFHRWLIAPKPSTHPKQCDWISGGCMFIRREVLATIGLFDEDFFLYFEETDLCHRASRHGLQTWYVPSAVIMHWAGGSTGIVLDGRPPLPMPICWFQSRRHYLRKYHSAFYVCCCDLVFALGRSFWQLRAWIRKQPSEDHPRFLRDFVRFNLLGKRWD